MEDCKKKVAWYFRPVVIVLAILSLGPLALPLVWFSPVIKKAYKIAITVIVLILTYLSARAAVSMYNTLLEQLKELINVMS